MDNEISQSFPDVSNFMAQTYMDEQEIQSARSADAQPGNGGNVEGMLQILEDRVSLLSTDFSSIIENVTKSLDSILIGSRDTLDQVSSLLEDQRKESQDRENLLEEKFLLADKQDSSISIVDPLIEIIRSVEELGLDIIKIKPEDADGGLLDAIKSMPKWVIGTLIAMGVVTAAQLGYPESGGGGEENLEPGIGNGGDLSISGDPNASVMHKNLGTNYGEYKKVGGTISWRNNNPGNIVFEKGGFAEKMGAIGYTMGTKNHRIAVFPTMEMGNEAKKTLLFGPKSNYLNMSIRKMVERYAPRASGNNTDAYVAAITKALGVPETTILSSLSEAQRDTFLQTIIKVEGFREGVVIPLEGNKRSNATGSNAATIEPGAENEITGILKNLAKKYDAQITSLKRSPEKNVEVEGAKNSFHLRGMAGDFIVPAKNRQAFIKEAESMGLEAIIYKSHIHLEPAPGSSLLSKKKPDSEKKVSSVNENPSSGQDLLRNSQDVRKNKIQETKNMVNIMNGGGKQKPSNVQQAPQLIPAINLHNSMVA